MNFAPQLRSRALVRAFLLAMILSAVGIAFAHPTPQQALGGISGHVYRKDTGAPLAGAFVSLYHSTSQKFGDNQITRTGADGAYYFSQLVPGKYSVGAQRTGFIDARYVQRHQGDDDDAEDYSTSINLEPGQNLDDVDMQLSPAGVISGTIVDDNNVPVKGLEISAIQPQFTAGGTIDLENFDRVFAQTDDLGRYRLSGLDAGSYCIFANGDVVADMSYAGAPREIKFGHIFYPQASSIAEAQRIRVTSGAEIMDIDFVLTPQLKLHTVSGTLSNIAPKPVGAPSISLTPLVPLRFGPVIDAGYTTTGADGAFTIPNIPNGDYYLVARQLLGDEPLKKESATSFSASVHVQDADVKLNGAMERPGGVRGRIAWDGGNAVTSFKSLVVWLNPAEQSSPYEHSLSGPINDDGTFEITAITPGSYFFRTNYTTLANRPGNMKTVYIKRAECAGVDYTARAVTIEPDTNLNDCTLTLAAEDSVLNGKVLDGETPVRNFVVVAIPASPELRTSEVYPRDTTTDASGRFKLRLLPGDYLLFAVPQDPEQTYFALDFVDRNIGSAERVTIGQSETRMIQLKPIRSPQ